MPISNVCEDYHRERGEKVSLKKLHSSRGSSVLKLSPKLAKFSCVKEKFNLFLNV